MQHSTYIGNPTFRAFRGEKKTHYVPVDILNAADNVLVDVRDPKSIGFGGSMFDITTTEGVDVVKGPWHGTVPYDVCSVGELHFTTVTIIANAESIPFKDRATTLMEYGEGTIERRFAITGEVLYDEYPNKVLGTFYRGDRIAQQLADLRQEELFVAVNTAGGAHNHWCEPGDKLHPRATRNPRRNHSLSAEQEGVITS